MQEIEVSPELERNFKFGRDSVRFISLAKWGTLGMADDSAPKWKGVVKFSGNGCMESNPRKSSNATVEEIKLIYDGRSNDINSDKRSKIVKERFISFENIQFKEFPDLFSIDEIPSVRLTLFVKPGEGALVYYQHTAPNGERKFGTKAEQSDIEYILPRPTKLNDCSLRDRLTYHILILPQKKVIENGDGRFIQTGSKRNEKFVVKILTFKRENSESETIIKKLYYHVFGHTYKLLLWKPDNFNFEVADSSEINRDKKTQIFSRDILSYSRRI